MAYGTLDPVLEISQVSKKFGSKKIINNISLNVTTGEFISLLGPSGSGKTTLLRMIAGHDQPDQGRIVLGGKNITTTLPYRRPIHTVFQRYALFPHLNVFDNVAFGPRCQKVSESEIRSRVEEILKLVNLNGYQNRAISNLSGGESQRVALARALVNRPELLLLDEPLGALDFQLRLQLQNELVSIQKKFGITFLFVTHDQQEALNMSDRVAILNGGELKQVGTPHEIYESPQNLFVAQFVGSLNELEAVVKERVSDSVLVLDVPGYGPLQADSGTGDSLAVGVRGKLCVRPEKLMMYSKRPTTMANMLEARIKSQTYLGAQTRFELTLSQGHPFLVFQQNTQKLPKKIFKNGDPVFIGWQTNATHFFTA